MTLIMLITGWDSHELETWVNAALLKANLDDQVCEKDEHIGKVIRVFCKKGATDSFPLTHSITERGLHIIDINWKD